MKNGANRSVCTIFLCLPYIGLRNRKVVKALKRSGGRGASPFVLLSLAFALGILTSVFLPDILLIVMLTAILLFLCILFLR